MKTQVPSSGAGGEGQAPGADDVSPLAPVRNREARREVQRLDPEEVHEAGDAVGLRPLNHKVCGFCSFEHDLGPDPHLPRLEVPTGQEGMLWLCRALAPWNERRLFRNGKIGKQKISDHARRAADLLPESAHAWGWLGIALREEGRAAEADVALENAARWIEGVWEREPDASLARWIGLIGPTFTQAKDIERARATIARRLG